MGIWAAVKYALNSTLGTSSFSPIDKIVNRLWGGYKLSQPMEPLRFLRM